MTAASVQDRDGAAQVVARACRKAPTIERFYTDRATVVSAPADQGWHYRMQPYRAMLARRGVEQSMSHKDNCFDNAAIESFFGPLKAEYLHLERPDSIDALEAGVHDYVHYYNHQRIKLGLQGLSPVEYRFRSTA